MELAIQYNKTRPHKALMITLAVILLCMLIPIGIVVGSELGGYISEKVIVREGTINSQLVIGLNGDSNSLLDIYLGTIGMSPNTGAFPVINTIPLFLAFILIYVLLKMMSGQKIGITELIVVAILIYLVLGIMPGIQGTITRLLGGEGLW